MSNVLPAQTVADIRRLSASGMGVRAVARTLGISTYAAAKYLVAAPCACGEPSGHRGWCKPRYAKSAARQAFHAARSGRHIDVPPPIKLSRVSARSAVKRRWLGVSGKLFPPGRHEYYGIIGEVEREVCRFCLEFRDDVRSELLVAAFEGRVRRDEIPRAALFFYMRERRHMFGRRSYDESEAEDLATIMATREAAAAALPEEME